MSSPPTTLGQYQIIREIARSNDIVYEAWDALMNRRVAIKELNVPGGSTPQQTEDRIGRFRREAQAVGTLNHPNIMTVFSFGTDQDRHFMAMEYLDGTTLRHEIDSKGFLSQERAVEIAIDVLRGLEHAHNSGVIHRDIKPDNIQITSSGQVKITDFGIARLTFQPNLTMDGQVFGTPSYMSPEQVVGKEIDARSDLFSVGVMLFEMLSGSKPFLGDNVVAIATAIASFTPQKPPQIENAVWQVLQKSIDKTPSMRYANAAAMREELDNAVQMGPSVYAAQQNAPAAFQPDPYAQQNPYGQSIYNMPQAIGMQPGVPGQSQYIQTPYGQQPVGGQYGPVPPIPIAPNQYGGGIQPPPIISNQAPYTQQPYQPAYSPNSYGPYNPYNGPLPGQYPAPNPGVYYPPPPRQPLFKPETKQFLQRLGLMLLLLLTFFVVIVIVFNQILNYKAPNPGAGLSPKDSAASSSSGSGGGSGDSSPSPDATGTQSDPGKVAQAPNREDAEAAFKSKRDAESLAAEALQLYNKARAHGDAGKRQELYADAGKAWAGAAAVDEKASANANPNNEQIRTLHENAARAYFAAASEAQALTKPKSIIRDLLYKARDNAYQGTDLYKQIDDAINSLVVR